MPTPEELQRVADLVASLSGKPPPKQKQKADPPKSKQPHAKALFTAGMKLCLLKPNTKAPVGEGWNKPENCVTVFDDNATGYGLPLAINGRCSIDPDNVERSRIIFKAWGFDYEEIMSAGVRTISTRAGSGGRSQFADPGGLLWLKVRFKEADGRNTIALELRATSANLQDVIPGLTYLDGSGKPCTQSYANGKTFLDPVALPADFAAFWKRCSEDAEFWMKQEVRAQVAILEAEGAAGARVMHDYSGHGLPFADINKALRAWFNESNDVESLLVKHGYVPAGRNRFAAPNSTGEPGVRLIPKHESLWQSSHGSDPLNGTFDAAAASIILDFAGDVEGWVTEMSQRRAAGEFADDFAKKKEAPPNEEPKAEQKGSLTMRLLTPYIVTKEDANQMCDTDWWIPNLIPKSHIVSLPAPSGAGKTAVAIACCNILASEHFADVFFVSLDSSPADIKYQQGQAAEYGYHVVQPDAKQGLSLSDFKQSLVQLADEADDMSNTILFIDTLKKVVAMLNKDAATALYKLLRRLVAKGATVVLLSHTNKYAGEDGNTVFEGTGDHRADVDDMIYLDYFRNEEGGYNDITTRPDKQRANFEPISLRVWFRGERRVEFLDSVLVIKNEIDTEVEEKARASLGGGRKTMTNLVRDVAAVCEHSKEVVRKALVRLSNDDGPLERFQNNGRGGGYTVGVRLA